HEARGKLPAGMQLSITALLDWFRDGTALPEVLNEVDEFVPQFYDVSDLKTATGPINVQYTQSAELRPIAARIDAKVWSAKFNRYGKPYRIGISTFGRAGIVSQGGLQLYGDVTPSALAGNSDFSVQSSTTAAGELLLKYRAERETRLFYATVRQGDSIEFAIP